MIYAQPGTANQQIGGVMPEGWIVMMLAKPEGNFIASASGEWMDGVVRVVSRFQGREAMRTTPYGAEEDGVSLFDAVEALLARPETPAYYRTAWDEIQQFELDSPLLLAIADELQLSRDRLPLLFAFADTLRA